jgi:hypothetical protein
VLEVDAPVAVLTVLDRRLPPRTMARLSGEGRLIDLDPTIGGSLSRFWRQFMSAAARSAATRRGGGGEKYLAAEGGRR